VETVKAHEYHAFPAIGNPDAREMAMQLRTKVFAGSRLDVNVCKSIYMLVIFIVSWRQIVESGVELQNSFANTYQLKLSVKNDNYGAYKTTNTKISGLEILPSAYGC
jgi:hypothetical protein